MKRLIIIGAGGHGQVVKEVAEATKVYDEMIFLDDNSNLALGNINSVVNYSKDNDVFCAIGNNEKREEILQMVKKLNYNIPTLIHPTAYVSPTAIIEEGVVVEPMAIINTNSLVKKGSIISVGAIVDHDVVIEAYSHINSGSICKAGSRIKAKQKLESGEVIKGY